MALVFGFRLVPIALEIRDHINIALRFLWAADVTSVIRPVTEGRFAAVVCFQESLNLSATSTDAGWAMRVFLGFSRCLCAQVCCYDDRNGDYGCYSEPQFGAPHSPQVQHRCGWLSRNPRCTNDSGQEPRLCSF